MKPVMAVIGIVLCIHAVIIMMIFPLMLLIQPEITVLGMIGDFWVFGSCFVITFLIFTTGLILAAIGFSKDESERIAKE